MEIFSIVLSCEVGVIKNVIWEVILDGDILNEYEVVFVFMMKKVEEMGISMMVK